MLRVCLLIATLALSHAQDDYCFGKDNERPQTRHFTTKTAYQIIKGTNMDKQYLVPGCEPQKLWIFHRHGTRLPPKSTIEKMSRLEQLRDEIGKNYRIRQTRPDTNALCQADLTALLMWHGNSSITPDQANYLTSQGYDDLRGTAKLYQKYFPSILRRDYNSKLYKFGHTDTQRAVESFKAFTEGLFGSGNVAQAEPLPDMEKLLRPYDMCPSFEGLMVENPESEYSKFRQSEIWNRTIAAISTRLGFQYSLENSDVELMYDMCRYEQAWQVDRTSFWCAVFTPDQVSVIEYAEDLKYYYAAGYGKDENADLSCHAVQDMLKHLKSNDAPNTVAYFAHSIGLLSLVTALGISKDTMKLTADNYEQMANRRWKTSNIDPFAGNFLAVKYHCPREPIEKAKVIFFLNQDAVDLNWCNVGLCDWSEVMERYQHIAEKDCNLAFCAGAATQGYIGGLLTLLAATLIYLIN